MYNLSTILANSHLHCDHLERSCLDLFECTCCICIAHSMILVMSLQFSKICSLGLYYSYCKGKHNTYCMYQKKKHSKKQYKYQSACTWKSFPT